MISKKQCMLQLNVTCRFALLTYKLINGFEMKILFPFKKPIYIEDDNIATEISSHGD